MSDVLSLYTQNGVPVANKEFEKVVFKHGLYVSPIDLNGFQDIMISDFDNFLFATRGRINGVYKTEYDTEDEELKPGLEVTLQEAVRLNPTSNYELVISQGKAYIAGKLVIVPLQDYVEVPDNDVYPDPITLHLILERVPKDYSPVALGEPGFHTTDGVHTSDRVEAGYRLRLVDEVPTEIDEDGNYSFIEIAKLYRPPILKQQDEVSLNKMDGADDEGQNWAKYEANLNILNVEKVTYVTYSGVTVTKIPTTITQEQWDALNDNSIITDMVPGVYYVPYTQNVLIVLQDIGLISQEKIWYLPHTSDMELTDMRYIIEDLPSVIEAAFTAVETLAIHRTNNFPNFIPDGLQDEFTDGIEDTFWTLPIAEDEPIEVKLDNVAVDPSNYTVTNVMERTYMREGEQVTEEWGRILFNNAPAAGQKLTVDFWHDAHTLYVENAKHESHRNDIDAHPLYINNTEMEEHQKNQDGTNPPINTVVAHDNRYYTQEFLDGPTGKSDKGHDHDTSYSLLGHGHQISDTDTLQALLAKIESSIGVYDKTTRLIFERVEEDVDGANTVFEVDSLLLDDETAKLIGVRADLTDDGINNPIILHMLLNPSSGTVSSLPDNFTIEDTSADFPTDGSLVGGKLNPNTDNDFTFEIVSNTETTITVDTDISSYTTTGQPYTVNDFTPGGVNPWTVPQKVSFGGNNLGLVVSAVQADDEVWTLWVDTEDVGVTHTLWWATKKLGEEVWSPPVNTGFLVDPDCRPSVVLRPTGTGDEDLMWLFTNQGNVYYSYISHGQTSWGDPVLFYDLPEDIKSPQGKYINNTGGTGDKIWLVYQREEAGVKNVYLRIFEADPPYTPFGTEILLSSGVLDCYYPTISQENADGGDVWIAWIPKNSQYDNRNKPIVTVLTAEGVEKVAPGYIPSDITLDLDNFNVDSRMELHHSTDGNVWLVYSVIEGGAFNIYYTHLKYEIATNSVVNVTPPVELNRGHEVSITERSDQTIWINYNQATQVYSQVRLIGAGEVKWTRETKILEFEEPPVDGSFFELRWQLPFSDIEGRLERVESELRTQRQKLEQLAALLNLSLDIDWEELIETLQTVLDGLSSPFEGEMTFIDPFHWQMPGSYDEDKASVLKIFMNGSRLSKNHDWSILNDIVTFNDATTDEYIVIAEWNQVTLGGSSSSGSASSESSESSESSASSESSQSIP